MKRLVTDLVLALIISTAIQIVIAIIAGITGGSFESTAINFLIVVLAFRVIDEVRGE